MENTCPFTPKQKAIIQAAEKCFLEHGYQVCSMDYIAQCAGVAKQTLYNNFKSKEELFSGVMNGMCCALYDPDIKTPNTQRPPKETLLRFAKRFFAMVTSPRVISVCRLITAEAHQNKELAQAFAENGPKMIIQNLAETFKAFHEAGTLHAPNPTLTAQHFVYSIKGELYNRFVLGLTPLPTEKEIDEYLEEVADRFCR